MNGVSNEVPFEKIHARAYRAKLWSITSLWPNRWWWSWLWCYIGYFSTSLCIQESFVNILICWQILCRWWLNTLVGLGVHAWFNTFIPAFFIFFMRSDTKKLRLDSTFDSPNLAWNWSLLSWNLTTCYLMTSMLKRLKCYSLVLSKKAIVKQIQSVRFFRTNNPKLANWPNEKWKIWNRL